MKNQWEDVERLYGVHYPTHRGKIADMYVREMRDVAVTFKGIKTESPAVVFKVVNKSPASNGPTLHNVVIGKHPSTGLLTMWCGDSSIVKADGERENKCEFWKKRAQLDPDGYMCKHIVYAYENLDSSKRAEIEERLADTWAASDNGERLSLGLKMWKNTFLFGPTGSGKTHELRRLLQENPGYEVCKIHISDGLEDVDVLQKLLPDPEKGGWQRRKGELRVAFDIAQEKKTIVQIEELTRSTRSLRNLLIKALDREGGFYTLHDITTGERIAVKAENILFMATANLGYSDTSEIDPALARRFPIFIFHDYNVQKEREILEEMVGAEIAKKLCKIAKEIRAQYRTGRLNCPLDTGSLIEWADAVANGVDIPEAASLTWLFRVVERDNMGYPEAGQLSAIGDLLNRV
ncbi:MAG: AAA family ATPase [Nitrospiraceae bacterium]|nr:AAA family ATPase [Nitrospiraceae bacterium]